MEHIDIDFTVLSSDSPKKLIVGDSSSNWLNAEDLPAFLYITLPNETEPLIFTFTKGAINVFNSSNLGLTPVGEDLIDLPIGVWKIRLQSGFEEVYVEKRHIQKSLVDLTGKEILLLKANDIPRYTHISGDLDVERIVSSIRTAQRTEIKRILGLPLYNKILFDFENDILDGDYLTIYQEFVVDMLVNYSAYYIVLFNGMRVENAGNLYNDPENSSSADIEDTEKIANRYNRLAASYELAFNKWISKNKVPEYPNSGSCENKNNSFKLNWLI